MSYVKQVLRGPQPKRLHILGEDCIIEWGKGPNIELLNKEIWSDLLSKSLNKEQAASYCKNNKFPFDDHLICPPSLFIFHVARCGSSASSNYFATDPENRTFNESPFLSSYFESASNTKNGLELVMKALGYSGGHHQKRLIIKFTSWEVRFVEEINKVFPNVPKILLVRDPKEVLVSQINAPSPLMLNKYKEEGEEEVSFVDFNLTNLESVFKNAFDVKNVFDKIIDYKSLFGELQTFEKELWHVNSQEERNLVLKDILQFDSKNLNEKFKPDVDRKRQMWREIKIDNHDALNQLAHYYHQLIS
jgi:hypothetical protein